MAILVPGCSLITFRINYVLDEYAQLSVYIASSEYCILGSYKITDIGTFSFR
jgi:hypothetical protein